MTVRVTDLPPPPPGKSGWPWTDERGSHPPTRPDGAPWPRISIVTPSFNQGEYLEETIRSVLLQGYPNLEYFVVDGGSSDQSVEIIRRYAGHLDGWVSEPDKGQADAINKGLALCTGEIFQFINSDDILAPGACRAVGAAWSNGVAVAGPVLEFDGAEERVVGNHRITCQTLLQHLRRDSWSSWHQPGVWLDRRNIAALGGYAVEYHYCFDLYTTVLYFERWPKICYLPDTLVRFRIHKSQKTTYGQSSMDIENGIVRERLTRSLRTARMRREARIGLLRSRWPAAVARIRASNKSPLAKAAELTLALLGHPRAAMHRLTLGAIRRELSDAARPKSAP